MERRSKFVLLGMLLGIALIALGAYYRQDTQPKTKQTHHRNSTNPNDRHNQRNQHNPKNTRNNPSTTAERALEKQSLAQGYTPTQDVGEVGAKFGRFESQENVEFGGDGYERLEKSPLLFFNDTMLSYENGGSVVVAKRDALRVQAKNLPESSIAMSVSMRMLRGKMAGCRLTEVPRDTLFYAMGLRSGDVIVEINGGLPDIEESCLDFVLLALKFGHADVAFLRGEQKRHVRLKPSE